MTTISNGRVRMWSLVRELLVRESLLAPIVTISLLATNALAGDPQQGRSNAEQGGQSAPNQSTAAPAPKTIDLSQEFTGFDGCFVLLDATTNQRYEFRPERLDERLSPCSTFKIPNALIGLETGVLTGPEHAMKWDGTHRSRQAENRDQTLRSAVRDSVIWFFQRSAEQVGPERMQTWLDQLHYGNRDTSGGLTRFWVNSSLTVSANEQLALLDLLRRDALPMSARSQAIVRDILVLARDDGGIEESASGAEASAPPRPAAPVENAAPHGSVYRAKSGSGGLGDRSVLGWWVGWVTTDGRDYVFAANIKGERDANGYKTCRGIVEKALARFEKGDFGPVGLRLPKPSAP